MARFQVIGINDKRDFCECCGRTGLQMVVWILDTETDEHKHFGTTCATQPAKGFDCIPELKAKLRTVRARIKASWGQAAAQYKAAGGTYINSRDEQGSPVATPADPALWAKLKADCEARVLSMGVN